LQAESEWLVFALIVICNKYFNRICVFSPAAEEKKTAACRSAFKRVILQKRLPDYTLWKYQWE